MVAPKGNGRWLRKYKLFFLIGLVILLFQILLFVHFLELNGTSAIDDFPVKVTKASGKKPLNVTVLKADELGFKPECEITGKEAVSAINRAKSLSCKQLIANVTCRSLEGLLYPKKLQSRCPNGGKAPGRSLGCFKDENNYRLLSGYFGVNKKLNSPQYCLQLCLQSGFEFAGVQYSNECFCGNDEPPSKFKLPDSSCNMKCPGDAHASCGGYYTINIFQTGIKKFVPQVANTEPSPGSPPVRIVFLLTINGRALRQVQRLLKILYHRNHFYYIHVDVREDYLFRSLLPLERRLPNVRLTRRRFATIWGGASLLSMLLSCMTELLSLWQWDFVLNLSESDFPVKQLSALEAFLAANRDRNFVKSHGRDTQRFLQKQGLDKTFVECDMRMWRVADRPLPHGLQMDGGSDWVALSRPFVEYVIEGDALIDGLRDVFKFTLLPAESFFHTVLRNSQFCDSYVDNNLHVTNWKRKLGCKCQYKHVVDWCGCSPNDFRPDDWPRIQGTSSRQLFFARKFEPIINQAVILKLELWLFGLDKPNRTKANLHAYWQSIYDQSDLSPTVDDALRTILASVGRVWARNQSCQLDEPISATSYHFRDLYQYTLVHFSRVEIAFRPRNLTYLRAARLKELTVSGDFDQKEQTSRNFARLLSPFSDPVLIYKFSAGDVTENFTGLWIDPTGSLVDVTDISIDENAIVGHSKPALKQPHLPGLWSVRLVLHDAVLAEVKFLITPLEFYGGKPLSVSDAALVHGGSQGRVISDFDRFLSERSDNFLRMLSANNAKKTGKELRDWIDSLFDKFYVIEKVCSFGDFCDVQLQQCSKTDWSSFAPDPKSELGEINAQTGMFDIW